MMRTAKKVVVIGAGPGGLASALLLAKAGLDVTVLERRSRVGGRTSAIEADGFRFDTGPTFFLFPLALRRIFSAIGRDLDTEVPMVRLDPQYHLIFGSGGDIKASPDISRLEAEVARIAPADAAQIRRFLTENRQKLARFQPSLESPFLSWRSALTVPMLKMLPLLRPWRCLDSELGRYFRDPRIRLAFSFQSKYLGMSPFQCPSLFSILSFLEYEYGVYHPIGGCSAIMERLAEIAEEMGVRVECDAEVEQIEFQGRQVVALRTEKARYPADAIVMNADFAAAAQKLIPEQLRRNWSNRKIETRKYSCSTFMLYLGIDGTFDHLAHHTIYMSKDYRQNLLDIEESHVLSEDPSFYIQNACVTDPTLAPAGKSTLYVLVPVTHETANVHWPKVAGRFRDQVLQQVETKLGLDGLKERIVSETMITPSDWRDDLGVYRGATFSMAHNLGQMLHLRPKNRFDGVDGMYLVGGGTHPGSGLPVIFESARISSRLLLDDFGMPRDWIDVPSSLEVPEYISQESRN